VLWPPDTRDGSLFATLKRLLAERLRDRAPPADESWEGALAPALARAGLTVERNERVAHAMSHESPEAFFDALARDGPARATALARGEAFMAELRAAFLAAWAGTPGPVVHRPEARHLIARARAST
jgi:hypothetical protein